MQGLILTYNSGNCNIDTTTNALGKKTTPSKYGNLKIYPCRISGVYLYHKHNVAQPLLKEKPPYQKSVKEPLRPDFSSKHGTHSHPYPSTFSHNCKGNIGRPQHVEIYKGIPQCHLITPRKQGLYYGLIQGLMVVDTLSSWWLNQPL